MLYFGIDQPARQITISLRGDHGDALQARQVSTQPEKIQAFFPKLTRDCVRRSESFIAVLEVCEEKSGKSKPNPIGGQRKPSDAVPLRHVRTSR